MLEKLFEQFSNQQPISINLTISLAYYSWEMRDIIAGAVSIIP